MVSAQTQWGEEPTVNRAAEHACDPGPDRGGEAPPESHHVGHLVASIWGPGRPASKDHWPWKEDGPQQP